MKGADARPKGQHKCQPRQQVGNLARAGGLLYWAGECQVRLRAQASSLTSGGSMPRGHNWLSPSRGSGGAWDAHWEAVYSGWLTNHLRCCWAQRATESRFSLLDQATHRNTAEVEGKQLAQSTRAIQANQLLYSKQCWLCQEIATARQEPVEKPALFYSFQSLVPMTLRHHTKKGGRKSYIHKPTSANPCDAPGTATTQRWHIMELAVSQPWSPSQKLSSQGAFESHLLIHFQWA